MLSIRRAIRRPTPYVPTAALASVVLLLIGYFVVCNRIELDKASVRLPRALLREEVPRAAAYVSLDERGVIRVSAGREASVPVAGVEELQSFAAGLIGKDPEHAFVIKAGQATRYRVIDRIIDALRQARVQRVYLLSDQRTVEDENRGAS